MAKQYILRTTTGLYIGRGKGNDASPKAYGLHQQPSDGDWRPSADVAELEAMNWRAHAQRLKIECPEFEVISRNS